MLESLSQCQRLRRAGRAAPCPGLQGRSSGWPDPAFRCPMVVLAALSVGPRDASGEAERRLRWL